MKVYFAFAGKEKRLTVKCSITQPFPSDITWLVLRRSDGKHLKFFTIFQELLFKKKADNGFLEFIN